VTRSLVHMDLELFPITGEGIPKHLDFGFRGVMVLGSIVALERGLNPLELSGIGEEALIENHARREIAQARKPVEGQSPSHAETR